MEIENRLNYIFEGISAVEDYNNKLSFLCKFDYFPLQTIAKLDWNLFGYGVRDNVWHNGKIDFSNCITKKIRFSNKYWFCVFQLDNIYYNTNLWFLKLHIKRRTTYPEIYVQNCKVFLPFLLWHLAMGQKTHHIRELTRRTCTRYQ